MTASNPSRVWFITGSSTGFGRELAAAALAKGDRVVATARNVASIEDLAAQHPETALAAAVDVRDRNSIDAAVAAAIERFGRIDVVVNNAGYGLAGALEEVSEQQVRDQFETNVFGVLNVTRAVLPLLRAQRSGHILNISSMGGRLTVPSMGIYHASKFALEGMSEALAHEVAAFGIKVTIVEPGGFFTDFVSRSLVVADGMPEYQFLRDEMASYSTNYLRGDAKVGMETLLRLVELDEPPLHFAIGPNVLPRIVAKLTADIDEYRQHEELWRASTANGKTIGEVA